MARRGAVSPIDLVLNSTTGPPVDQWFGFSVYELASTDITPVLFKDGTSTGQILWTVNMSSAAGNFEGKIFAHPIAVPSGVLHIDTTGNPLGVVFV